jgi:NAD-dependent SIR2 family protein deacetylase
MIKKAAQHIARAKHLLITAGSGLGVDSGLPDFRGKGLCANQSSICNTIILN